MNTRPQTDPTTAWPLGRGVTVLLADPNGLVALNKPAGVLSHPNEGGDRDRSLLEANYDHAAECYTWSVGEGGEPARAWLLNRLDAATSGVILLAADGEMAAEIRRQFREKHVAKTYQALVFGHPPRRADIWRDAVVVRKQGGQIRTTAGAGAIPAESRMSVVQSRGVGEGSLALIQLEPRTGRSHQLRVQCAKRHLPIVGDQTYGDFRRNREFAKRTGSKRMFLHSLATRFEYRWHGRAFTFAASAPLPADFRSWF